MVYDLIFHDLIKNVKKNQNKGNLNDVKPYT